MIPLPVPTEEAPEAVSAKRRAILDAAAELFLAQGYGAVSMDAVARAARVSKATLYAHFGAKDRLFAAIMEAGCTAMRQGAAASTGSLEGRPREALTAMGRHWLNFLLQPRCLAVYRMVVAEGPRFPELAESFHANGPRMTRAWLADWIAGQHAAGRLNAPDPERAAEQFLSLLRGDVFLRASLGLPAPDAAAVEATVAAAVESFCRTYSVD